MSDEIRPKLKVTQPDDGTLCLVEPVSDPFVLVIYGASGDLAARKVLPSVYKLYRQRLLPDKFAVVGVARTGFSDDSFRAAMLDAVKRFVPETFDADSWDDFAGRLYYQSIQYDSDESGKLLGERLDEIDKAFGISGNRVFYIALPPMLYETVIDNIGGAGLARKEHGWTRIIIEKPFGHSLKTSKTLTHTLHKYFEEDQIFRIDHYLGKETVQNILMFRFANAIYEPIWNRRYIDHVQITAAESLGIEHRAGYYESAGVIRDMFQNHILQLLALVAMEPPARFEAEEVRNEKTKVFRSIRPFDTRKMDESWAVGQYVVGIVDGKPVPDYRSEKDVPAGSNISTFAAGVFHVDNWRWQGVPFFLRSGKRLAKGITEIAIQFKAAPHLMFDRVLAGYAGPNVLVFRIKPDEGIMQSFFTKVAGSRLCLQQVRMEFSYESVSGGAAFDAYQKVLLDCMSGDQMLFVRQDGIELTWELLDPVLSALAGFGPPAPYASGSEGPANADSLISKTGRNWRRLAQL